MQKVVRKMSTKKAIGGSVVAIVILLVSQMMAQFLAVPFVLLNVPLGLCNVVAGIGYLVLCYLLLNLYVKKGLKINAEECGMPKFNVKWKWLGIALLLPVVVMSVYLLFFPGEYVSSNMNGSKIFETLGAGVFFIGIAAGFVEEMVFRGVILNCLKERWNLKVAVILPSLLFGIVLILGTEYSLGSCLLVIVAGTMVGIMFSFIAIESGSVWNSGIVHALWNIIIIGGGLSIGDKVYEDAILSYVLDTKSFALTGGEFGIESSLIALMAYLGVIIITWIMIKKKAK